MRSLRAIALSVLSIQIAITLLIAMMALGLAYRSNQTTALTRAHNARATQAQRVTDALLTARRLEKEYFFAINNPNRNISLTKARSAWYGAHARLGDELKRLEPMLQTDAERAQLAAWQRIHRTYGEMFTLIVSQYAAPTSTPQGANDAMNAFEEPLAQLLAQTAGYAREQTAIADASWETLARQRSATITILAVIGAAAILLSAGLSIWLSRRATEPILALTAGAERVAAGDLQVRVDAHDRHELGRLGMAFNRMTEQLATQRAAIIARAAELESSNRQQQELLAQLQASLDERDALTATIRELSVPVIPVLPGVLIVPLVGAFDTARAAELHETVLQAVEQSRARRVLLDVTGVPVMDTGVAQMVIQLTDALGLLGAQPTLVGVRPEVAQTLVQLGIQFHRLDIKADLQSAVTDHMSRPVTIGRG